MPSSTSSSERLTASDRPGVAQPVPQRDVPAQPWGVIAACALVLFALLLAGWEWHWRAFGVAPSTSNSDGLWSNQRRRIDSGEGGRTVLIGSSRVLFGVDLDSWQRLSGEPLIQLALQGTTPLYTLEDLADDPQFTGHLLVGIAPSVFFTGRALRKNMVDYYRKEGPSQRVGQWLAAHLIEPWLAFCDPDFALSTVLERQTWWPARAGLPSRIQVRKLSVTAPDRNTHLWSKVEQDPEYRAMARKIWAQDFAPPASQLATFAKTSEEHITRAAAAVAKLRARKVDVTFIRMPSTGEYLASEDRVFPRAKTWDVLLARTHARGIHFQDYPELQGYELPEWSHLATKERQRFTEALYRVLTRERRPE